MVEFLGKIVMIGCGSVAQCTLPLIFKLIKISPHQITIIDFDDKRNRVKEQLQLGVHYIQKKITPDNYKQILNDYLAKGDICLDLAWGLDTFSLIEWCHDHGVTYLNTSLEVWDPLTTLNEKPLNELTLYSRHMRLRELIQQWKGKKGPTAIVDHGANPGLVSHFTKSALLTIANKIVEDSKDSKISQKSERINDLQKAIRDENFAQLAYLTGVKSIHISERDSQITQTPKAPNEFVNTWSIIGLVEEGLAPSEIGWGIHEKELPPEAILHLQGPKNQLFLSRKGIHTWVRSWVPSGEIKGMVIRHGEAFSISDHLTLWNSHQEPLYRPTVHYAYLPSDSTLHSLEELKKHHYQLHPHLRILNDEIIAGSDELGCLLMGHDFKVWWIGSVLDIETTRKLVPGQNATTLQVAASVVAGLIYLIKHPLLGFCLPDDLNHREILDIAMPYLGEFISKRVDWSPLCEKDKVKDEDKWQFSSFYCPEMD